MTAAERTLAALRADVLTGGLAPGEQLVQEDIADKYGVSRVPVREALQLLTSEGLVSHVPHRGYFVTELSISDLSEVYRLRQLLEAEAIRAAVPALRDDDVTTLEALALAVQDADDLEDLTAANRRFHFALFEAAGMAASPACCANSGTPPMSTAASTSSRVSTVLGCMPNTLRC